MEINAFKPLLAIPSVQWKHLINIRSLMGGDSLVVYSLVVVVPMVCEGFALGLSFRYVSWCPF